QSPSPLDVQGEIGVSEAKPARAAELLERRHELPCFAPATPAARAVREAGERVEQRVEVRRNTEAEVIEVIAGVADDDELTVTEHTRQAEHELGAADAPGQRENLAAHWNRSSPRGRSSAVAA